MTTEYEKQLEEQIEKLEALWFEDTKGLEAINGALETVVSNSKEIEELILTLQDPNSNTNKHGPEVYQAVKEKIHSKFMQLSRSINATKIVIDNIRKLPKRL